MSRDVDFAVGVLLRTYGRDVSLYDESFLAKSLDRRQAETSLERSAYLDCLSRNSAEAGEFFDSLSITYSEFFRNPLTFAVLEQLVVPCLGDLVARAARHLIRVWSAGCAAGQEAYSVAILLDELSAGRAGAVPFRIFATDISQAALAAARWGVYEAAAMRHVRLKHVRDYFSPHGETYAIVSGLRDRVDFSFHDLLDEHSSCPPASIYGDFDLVVCSNLLFYYRPEIRRLILDRLCRSLSPHGYLVTGETERTILDQADGWRAIAPPAAVFQRTQPCT